MPQTCYLLRRTQRIRCSGGSPVNAPWFGGTCSPGRRACSALAAGVATEISMEVGAQRSREVAAAGPDHRYYNRVSGSRLQVAIK